MTRQQLVDATKGLVRAVARTARKPAISARLRRTGLAAPLSRKSFIDQTPKGDRILEIGPFDNPQLSGTGVRYFDVLASGDLRRRAAELDRNPLRVPHIHYVSPTGDLGIVGDEFDAALSCHAVEHQPDLVRHLNGVASLLRPGGKYLLVIPDKRFTFDHFLPESTLDEVLEASREGRTIHGVAAVNSHFLATTHNSAVRHWLGLHGRVVIDESRRRYARDAASRAAAGEYVDVHSWIFSPVRFLQIMTHLCSSGLVPFRTAIVHETDVLASEFFAVLSLPASDM